jgi:hypothetical protein
VKAVFDTGSQIIEGVNEISKMIEALKGSSKEL